MTGMNYQFHNKGVALAMTVMTGHISAQEGKTLLLFLHICLYIICGYTHITPY